MARFNNLTGKKFGFLTVISLHSTGTRTFWNVVWDCGTMKKIEAYTLHKGRTLSCGCKKRELTTKKIRKQIEIGSVFGKLKIISETDIKYLPSGQSNRTFVVKCECGTVKEVRLVHLLHHKTKSCGCDQGEHHRMSKTKLYRVWRQMNERCHKSYAKESNKRSYQQRGITVCDAWRNSFIAFSKWASENGYQEGLEIDRTDNDKGYSPENCRWVTRLVNVNNRRDTVMVVTKEGRIALTDYLRLKKINESYWCSIRHKVHRGHDVEKVVEKYINS